MGKYYDPNKDYSTELKRTDLTAAERAQLTQERQNKIDAVYGGNEPTMDGSDKTFSSVYGTDGSGKSSASSGFQGSATSVNTYTSDQDAIKDQMNQNSIKWHSATQAEQEQLHAANEALAKLLGGDVSFDGASGSWSGSAQYPTQFKDFDAGQAPSYTNRYDSKINDLAESILSRDPFSYDYANDPLYQYYANLYQRNGERAMRDTLGEMAARTGGLSSSYAGSMAQGSYNNYMQGLNDIVPELYQLAYSIYQDEGDTERANLEMLQALESGDYTKYLNLLQQYNTDRSFDYGVLGDQIALDYQREQDALSAAQDAYKAQQKASGTSGGTTTGSTPSVTDTGSGLFTLADEYAQKGGDPEDFIKLHWKEYGYSSQTAALSGYRVYQTENSYNAETGYNSASVTAGDLGKLDYDPDEGIFTWNGRRFNSLSALSSALENADLSESEYQRIVRALNAYGFAV